MIRPAGPQDAAAIAAIWNPVIRSSVATFNSAEKPVEEIAALIAARQSDGHGFFVAEDHVAVLGFAHYGQFRGGVGYRHTGEHTVILSPDAGGRGLGRALMARIEDHARDGGMHSLFAGVSAENTAGVAFHAALGYAQVARLAQVGRKFDRWFDLILMQKML